MYTALFTIYNSLSEILRIPGNVRRRNLDVHFFSFFKKHTVIPQPKCKTHKKKKKYLKVCPPCLAFRKLSFIECLKCHFYHFGSGVILLFEHSPSRSSEIDYFEILSHQQENQFAWQFFVKFNLLLFFPFPNVLSHFLRQFFFSVKKYEKLRNCLFNMKNWIKLFMKKDS